MKLERGQQNLGEGNGAGQGVIELGKGGGD